jgi:hypothetical protein
MTAPAHPLKVRVMNAQFGDHGAMKTSGEHWSSSWRHEAPRQNKMERGQQDESVRENFIIQTRVFSLEMRSAPVFGSASMS